MAVQDSRTINILWTTLMILMRISYGSNPYLVRVFEAPMENLQKIGAFSPQNWLSSKIFSIHSLQKTFCLSFAKLFSN